MTDNIQVSIITVGMNHLPLIKEYLHSLFIQFKPTISFELIYVDNCSKDGSVEYIRSNYPQVKILQNETIKGFAANNNIGVKHSSGEYILILNPDIILLSGSVDNLYKYLKENESVGILIPKLLNRDMSTQYSVRRFMNLNILWSLFLRRIGIKPKAAEIENYLLLNSDRSKIQPVDWALGAAMFMRKKWFEELKGFDEGYFMYVEDVDICLRSWKKKKPVIYFPDAVFIHAHQRSSSKKLNKQAVIHAKSMIRFCLKHNILFKTYSFH